jgi:TPM domain
MTSILSSRPGRIWLALLAFCATLSLAATRSTAGTIVDNAHIFSPTAVSNAQQVIDQIRARHQKDLNIETIASVPADQQDALAAQGKDAFFEQWARQRAKAMGTDGVYVLICMDPRHLQVEVGNRTQTREFTLSDREALRNQLTAHFKAGEFDAGLTDAASFVSDRMDANTRLSGVTGNGTTGIGQGVPLNGGGGHGGWICLGAIVLFLVVIFMRRNTGYGGYGPGNYPPGQMGWGGGGGGGFGRSLLGGILGGALGSWGYDRFSRGGGFGDSSSSGGGGGGGSDFSGSSGVDSSFTGSGSDFGGGGGGGDSGGGGGGGGGGDF